MKSPSQIPKLFALLCSTLLFTSGCRDMPVQEAARAGRTTSRSLVEPTSAAVEPLDIEAERLVKARELGPTPRLSTIDWDAAGGHPPMTANRLEPAQVSRLLEVPLPVLLPSDAELLSSAEITTGERWYAASMPSDDHTVFIQGTATAFRLPDGVPSVADSSDFRLTRDELIVSLSFVEYGAAYTIRVACESPLTDPRCTGDDYALALAESLVRVGVAP